MSGVHEPCSTNEVFLGNTDKGESKLDEFKTRGIRTIRLGRQAYDIDGKPLHSSYKPMFIGRTEEQIYSNIMMEKTFGKFWRNG